MEIRAKSRKRRGVKGLMKSIDTYGYPITLTYKSQSEYQSVFGGMLTILFRLLVLLYVMY